MMTTGLADGGVECRMRPAARNSSRIVSICGHERIHAIGARGHRGLSGGTEISNGRREHEPKSLGDVEKTSANSIRVSPNMVMTSGSQPGPRKSNDFLGDASAACARLVGSYRAGRSLSDQAKR